MRQREHIILIGPMGSGKSTLGHALATRLALPFVDLDTRIEADAGCSIALLFQRENEAGFRARESRVLQDVLSGPAAVIATGGGAVLAERNCRSMRDAGIVVYLQVDPDVQLVRLEGDTTRPLLATPDRAQRLAQLQAQREPLYRQTAHLCFDTSPAGTDATALAERLALYRATHA